MKLAEIQVGWDRFEAAMAENGGELTPDLAAGLECLNLAEQDKLDGYVFYIRSQEGEVASLRALEAEIAAKRKARESRIEWCKAHVRQYMEQRGATDLCGAIYRFKLQANGKPGVEVLVPAEMLPSMWQRVTVVADKEAMRAELEHPESSGTLEFDSITVARFGPPTTSLRIY